MKLISNEQLKFWGRLGDVHHGGIPCSNQTRSERALINQRGDVARELLACRQVLLTVASSKMSIKTLNAVCALLPLFKESESEGSLSAEEQS